MTQEHKEHNFHSIFFTAVVLILVLAAGAKGHSQREAERKEVIVDVVAPAVSVFPPVVKSTASLVGVVQSAVLMPSISAIAATVREMNGKKPLFDFNSNKQWSTASLVKLLTATVALENLNLEQMIKISPMAIATESSAGNLIAGRTYKLSELLRVLLVFSSNDAAVAIAEHFGKENFISLMNQKAVSIGMSNSRFFDPSGLSPLNLTTADDLTRLVNYVFFKHGNLFVISQEKIEGATHPFAGESDFLGGKTGFIDEAGGNLVSLFNYQGRPVMIIVLGSKQRAEDTKILKDWFLPN